MLQSPSQRPSQNHFVKQQPTLKTLDSKAGKIKPAYDHIQGTGAIPSSAKRTQPQDKDRLPAQHSGNCQARHPGPGKRQQGIIPWTVRTAPLWTKKRPGLCRWQALTRTELDEARARPVSCKREDTEDPGQHTKPRPGPETCQTNSAGSTGTKQARWRPGHSGKRKRPTGLEQALFQSTHPQKTRQCYRSINSYSSQPPSQEVPMTEHTPSQARPADINDTTG